MGRGNKLFKAQFSLKRIQKLKANKIFSSIILAVYVLGIFIRVINIMQAILEYELEKIL